MNKSGPESMFSLLGGLGVAEEQVRQIRKKMAANRERINEASLLALFSVDPTVLSDEAVELLMSSLKGNLDVLDKLGKTMETLGAVTKMLKE